MKQVTGKGLCLAVMNPRAVYKVPVEKDMDIKLKLLLPLPLQHEWLPCRFV